MSDKGDLNKGPVGMALLRVSAPMSIGILGVLLVGLADAYFLARKGGDALTAIGFVYPVIVALTSLSIGLGAGTNAVVSQAFGRGDDAGSVSRLTLHAMLISVTLASAVSLIFWLSAPWLFGLLGAKGTVLDQVMDYVPWWCISFPPMVCAMALNAVYRAAGKSIVPATTMLLQSAVNIALNPLLIFGWSFIPALGIEGAGMSTAFARIVGFALILGYGIHNGAVRFGIGTPFRDFAGSLKRITKVGAPASMSNAINPAGMAAVTAAVAVVGDAAVAGFGAATRVQSLLFVPMLALSSGIGPVVGQAWGAEDKDRAQKAVRLTFLTCLIYGAALAAAMLIFADWIAAVMTDGAEAARFTALYLQIVGFGFFGYGILVTANAAMNARDKALWSMSLSAARIGLIYVPGAWLAVTVAGYTGLVSIALLANVIAAWGALIACRATGLLAIDWAPVRIPAQAALRLIGQDASKAEAAAN